MEFKCKYCETNICIDIDQIGNDINCPACDRQLKLPEIPKETAKALQKLKDREKQIITEEEGNKKIAEAMLEEPASKETTMWRERLAASFQAANLSNIKTDYDFSDEDEDNPALVKSFDKMMDFISIKNASAFEEYYKLMCNFGSSFVFVFGLLVIVYSIILTSKTNNVLFLITGIVTLFVSFLLYYLSARFSIAGFNLIKNKELYFYTRNLHHAFGLTNLIISLALLFFGGYAGISHKSFVLAMIFVIGAIAAGHAAILFISPKVLNTKISKYEVSLGETGLSLIGFVFRVYILLSGLLLAAIPILDVVIFYLIFSLIYSTEFKTDELNYITASAILIAVAPFVTYVLYLFYRIFLDFYKAVLQISGNLSVFLESLYSENHKQ